MIRKNIFGKGEAEMIDRRVEIFPSRFEITSDEQLDVFRRYHDAYSREYFYILRKMFHTFAFDMRELAVDYYEVPIDTFVRSLTWLTYVQTLIYEMDINTELGIATEHKGAMIDLAETGQKIIDFLSEHDLIDAEIERCVREVVDYLTQEQNDLRGKVEYTVEQIFATLDLKSADLEMLRRVLLRVCEIDIEEHPMLIFKKIDTVREVFDDIRDYFEDMEIANFNTVIYLQKIGGDMTGGIEIIRDFLDSEMKEIQGLIQQEGAESRKKFEAIFDRLAEETKYFIAELQGLPKE